MKQIELYVGLTLAVILSVGVSLFAGHYQELQRAAAQNEQRGGVIHATSQGIARGVDVDAFLSSNDVVIGTGRDAFNHTITEAKRHEPETAARADRTVPVSVRNAYRERRLARERRGCTGSECP
jgi:hypothetical protein